MSHAPPFKDQRAAALDQALEEGQEAVTAAHEVITETRGKLARVEEALRKATPLRRYFPMADFVRGRDVDES